MQDLTYIRGLADKIKAGMNCRVFLFGSYAWGRPNSCSDVDLAVVVPDAEYDRKMDVKARKLSEHGTTPIDVIVIRDSTFAQAVQGSLSFEVRSRGVELIANKPKEPKMLAIRLPSEIENRLEALAQATGRTKTFYAREAILEHLDDLEDLYLAEQRLIEIRAGRSQTISLEEVMRHHGMEG